MIKSLVLLNPRSKRRKRRKMSALQAKYFGKGRKKISRRKRSRSSVAASVGRSRRQRSIKANPMKTRSRRRRKMSAKQMKYFGGGRKRRRTRKNPFTRSSARRAGRRSARRRTVRRRKSIIRSIRSRRGVRSVRAKRGHLNRLSVRLNPRRRGSRRRRSYRGNPFGLKLGGIGGMFRNLISKENLIMGAGAASGVVGGRYLGNKLDRWTNAAGDRYLPGLDGTPTMSATVLGGYKILGTFVLAQVLRKWAPNFAKGFALGGFAEGLITIWAAQSPKTFQQASGVGEFLAYTPPASIGVGGSASYQGSQAFMGVRPVNGAFDNESAFSGAWGGKL